MGIRTVESSVETASLPKLAPHVRLSFDPTRDRHVLLCPETIVALNTTSAAILQLCDGRRTVAEIVAELQERYEQVAADEVHTFLARIAAKHYVEITDG
ncbi:MAG TPA: pyrroloquinoline quinone biosynthesis peptide chaperone PqqD [Pseudonocardia sp.]